MTNVKNRLKKFLYLDWIPLIKNKTKIAISILLLCIALCVFIKDRILANMICLIAMFLCTLGDVSLNCVPLHKRPRSFMYAGAAFFMIAHIAYAISYRILIGNASYINTGSILATIFIGLCFLMALACIILSKSKDSLGIVMILFFGLYIIIIGINFITICSYSYIYNTVSWIGALFFLISDFIIGLETVFKLQKPILRKLVWIFYPLGQLLIITCH